MARNVNINFKASKEEKDEFYGFAESIDIPFSQFARQAIKKEIIRQKQESTLTNEQLAKSAVRAEKV